MDRSNRNHASKRNTVAASKYNVGYRKPPLETRFPKGVSGNGKGRPRGSKNSKTLLMAALKKKIEVNMGGRVRSMSRIEAFFEKLIVDALKGDSSARNILIKQLPSIDAGLLAQSEAENDDLIEADKQIIERYLARRTSGK